MSLSLNVLNHLGLNLYSNVPAVLSEAVANAWDADAEHVDVDILPDKGRIEIVDDGHGMDEHDVNNRYLRVGYRRRQDEDRPNRTPKHDRPVMGRKGIGKLSLFSHSGRSMNPSRREIMCAVDRLRRDWTPGDRAPAAGPNGEPVSVVLSKEHAKELRELKRSPDAEMSDELAAAEYSLSFRKISEYGWNNHV